MNQPDSLAGSARCPCGASATFAYVDVEVDEAETERTGWLCRRPIGPKRWLCQRHLNELKANIDIGVTSLAEARAAAIEAGQ